MTVITKETENNYVSIKGTLVSEFKFSHSSYGEKFYLVYLRAERLSGREDILPLMISERILDDLGDYAGRAVVVTGQFRSYNCHEGDRNHLALSVFVQEMDFTDDKAERNEIILNGYVCKQPVYRRTLLEREITDLLLAVNRPYGKSDYSPCIVWGKEARCAAEFEIGDKVRIHGRVQSREYRKEDASGSEKLIAYEVSVTRLEPEYG